MPSRYLSLPLLALALATAHAAPPAPDVVHDGPSEAVEAWVRAVDHADIDAIERMNPATAVAYTPSDNVLKGTEAIAGGYRGVFARYHAHATVRDAQYIRSGKLLASWGLFTLDLQPREGGDTVHLEGRFSDVAVRGADGWRYIVDHASSMPKTP